MKNKDIIVTFNGRKIDVKNITFSIKKANYTIPSYPILTSNAPKGIAAVDSGLPINN